MPEMETIQKWQAAKPLNSYFPISFPSGQKFNAMNCCCEECNKEIEPQQLRGTVAFVTPEVATIDAAGHCQECNLISTFHFRVRATPSAGVQLEWVDEDGQWTRQSMQLTGKGVLGGFARWVSRLLGGSA